MDDLLLVGIIKGIADLGQIGCGPLHRKRTLRLHHVLQRFSSDELHGDVVKPTRLAHLVDRHNVGMFEMRGALRLLAEACDVTGVVGERGRQHF